ncbi:MAG TPA: hypothetical protein VFD88_00200 [Clostridia bacterium]|nr:hypothetical protein [Clostridia bacterium]
MSASTSINGSTSTIRGTDSMYDAYAESAPSYMQAAAARAAGAAIVTHYQRLMEFAQFDEQVAEKLAAQHQQGRLGPYLSPVVISLTGMAETALAYFGLTLAVPSTSQAGQDGLLMLISQRGAIFTAIAIGVLSTVVTATVGRHLSLAHRGLLAEPIGQSERKD